MKLSIFAILFLISSCATTDKEALPKVKNKEPIDVDTAIQLARTGYVRSCIQAHKSHEPKKKWGAHCRKEGDAYIKEIFLFLTN
jgi:copper chaperone CopZ